MHRCPNCYKSLTDEFSYCPHCSQQQHLPQLSLKHIFADFFDTLFNLERGFLLTFRMLLFKPSVMFRRYFSGQRVRYSSPMRFFILAVLLSLLTSFAFHPKWNFMEQRPKNTTEWTDSIVINLGKDADQITKSKALKQWMNDYLKPILEFSEKNSLYIQIVNLFLVAGIVHLLVRKKKRYNYTELVCICLYLFGVWTAAGELLEGLAGLHKHGRLAFLLPAVFVFRKPLLRKLTRWRREKRLRPFVLLFLLLSAFLSISSPSLAPFVSLLFWAYYMKKLYSLSNLKSALYVLVFHALYLALLLSAGTAVLFLIVKFNT